DLGADAEPVDALGRHTGSVRLDCHLEAAGMQRIDRCFVELQERFTARAHHEAVLSGGRRPRVFDCLSEVVRGPKLTATFSVSSDEICVAELADRTVTILLQARPQVAPGEAAEDGRTACVAPFALQGVEDLLDLVGHSHAPWYCTGSVTPASAKPLSR